MRISSKYLKWQIQFVIFISITLFAQTGENGRQVISAELIRNAGISRVAEIVLLAEGWHSSTIDAFVWQTASSGFSSFQGQQWRVLVDGVETDTRIFDIHSLNLLPISIFEIDSVEIFNTTQIHSGVFNDKGLIHIHTRKPDSGFSFRATSWVGNEIGDPGPYIFTEFATPNIDRIGPDYSYTLAYRTGSFYIKTGLLEQNQYATNEAILTRNPLRTNNFLRIQMRSPFLQTGWQKGNAQHQLFAGYTTSADHFPEDLQGAGPLFFKPVLGEIATNRFYSVINLNGTQPLSSRLNFRYFFAYSQNELSQNTNFPNTPAFDWAIRRNAIGAESQYTTSQWHILSGFSFMNYNPSYLADQRLNSLKILRIYNQLELNYLKNVQQRMDLEWVQSQQESAIKTALHHNWQLNAAQQFNVVLSYAKRLPAEDQDFWFWVNRGYDLAERFMINYQIEDIDRNPTQTAIEFSWRHRLHSANQLTLSTALRRFLNLSLEQQDVQWLSFSRRFTGPITVRPDEHGIVFHLSGSYLREYPKRVHHHLFYTYQQELAAKEYFRWDWQTLPNHSFRYWLDWQAVQNFSIWSAFNYLSATRWRDYENAGISSDGGNLSHLPGRWIVDLGIQKYIWQRRMRGNLFFRNLFNRQEQSHPMGGDSDLRFFFQMEFYLNLR